MTAPAQPGSVRPDLLLSLRGWQKAAYREYFGRPRRDFLLVATPGAGKTAWALTVAAELLARREIAALTVVTPTEHLKHQWARAAHYVGIALDSSYRNAQGRASADFTGVAVTYAQVAAHPVLHRARTENRRTLVIFDEIHHAGDALSWGDAVREAFEPARRRLALTGTPFRTDTNPIPFVSYAPEPDGSRRSVSDYVYGYGPALSEGVVRPVIFLAYSGEMRWRTRAGDEITGTLGAPMLPDQLAQAWRTALDPDGEWVQRVLEAADKRLTEVRRGMPDAAGLVIATDHEDARAYAARLRRLTGSRPVVVLSDDPAASRKIAAFADSGRPLDGRGPDGLRGGGHPAAGRRGVRHQRRHGAVLRPGGGPVRPGPAARRDRVGVPAVDPGAARLRRGTGSRTRPRAAGHAGRRGRAGELAAAQRQRDTPDQLDEALPFEALQASAHFDRVLYDGAEFGTTAAEEDFLGLPGLLEPEQVALLLRKRQADQLRGSARAGAAPAWAAPARRAAPRPARPHRSPGRTWPRCARS